MKPVRIFGLLISCGILAFICSTLSCARSASCDLSVVLDEGVDLPAGFCVMKGLSEKDYVDGWPRYIVCEKDGSVMVLVPGKQFRMGSGAHQADEAPRHKVDVGTFYVDLYEVNNAQFNNFSRKAVAWGVWDNPCLANSQADMSESKCPLVRNAPAGSPDLEGHSCKVAGAVKLDFEYFKDYWSQGINDSHPARAVSWWEAWYYCRWVGKDLPTEAEWELAAGGGRGERMFPWGDQQPDGSRLYCNYGGPKLAEDGYEYTAPVSAFGAGRSAYGCYNMAGNVWEWCKDNYDASLYSAAVFTGRRGGVSERARQFSNPAGSRYGDAKVIRGGAYTSDIRDCRTTARAASKPNFHGKNIGFRGVLRIR